jgi:hypothetical protein
VAGDGSSMNPELCGEVGKRSASSMGGDEPVDLGLVEAALNGRTITGTISWRCPK